jgi:hypothetical protein
MRAIATTFTSFMESMSFIEEFFAPEHNVEAAGRFCHSFRTKAVMELDSLLLESVNGAPLAACHAHVLAARDAIYSFNV